MKRLSKRGAAGIVFACVLGLAATRHWHSYSSAGQKFVAETRPESRGKQQSPASRLRFTQRVDSETKSSSSAAEIFSEFERWWGTYNRVEDPSEDLVKAGEILAEQRQTALAELIQIDPEEALRLAVPYEIRKRLPQSIGRYVEENIAGDARYDVIGALPDNDGNLSAPISRYVTLNDRTFRAFVYGRRTAQTCKESIPLYGIAVGNFMAVAEHPVRVLGALEAADLLANSPASAKDCPISGAPAERSYAAQIGSRVEYFCHSSHIETLNAAFEKSEAESEPLLARKPLMRAQAIRPVAGEKTVLVIRVAFPDAPDESISARAAAELMRGANNFFLANSYGLLSLRATITPLIMLTRPRSWYTQISDVDSRFFALLRDARNAAVAENFDSAEFDLDCVHVIGNVIGPRGLIGGKGVTLYSTSVAQACHEFGHNLGFYHANAWKTMDGSVIGAGANIEYGNPFDAMGGGTSSEFFYNACYKSMLGWLPESAIQTISEDGTYRLYSTDVSSLEDNRTYALRVTKDQQREYWIETRTLSGGKYSGDLWLNWGPWSGSKDGTQLLDTTPGSEGGYYDAPLRLGRAFFDPDLGIKIVAKHREGTPDSVEVEVKHVHYLAAGIPALEVEIPTADDYYLWCRTPGRSSVVSIFIDGDANPQAALIDGNPSTEVRWRRIIDSSLNAKLLTLIQGRHSIRVIPEDPLTKVDALLLTDDSGEQFPPVFIPIPGETIISGETTEIPFSVVSIGSRPDAVKISASSSNSSLFPSKNLKFDGDAQARAIRVEPASSNTGSTEITLIAIGGDGFSSKTTFQLSVVGANSGSGPATASLNMHVGPHGEVILTLEGRPGASWTIQASNDFVSWETVALLRDVQPPVHVTDPDRDLQGRRFYRAMRY